jgi:nucleoprotein TPR
VKAAGLEEALEPLQRQVALLQATERSHQEEVTRSKEFAARWEKRTNDLLEKYGQVDLNEYQRVQKEAADALQAHAMALAAAKAAEAGFADLEAETTTIRAELAKVKSQFERAKKMIETGFNPKKLPIKVWQEEQEKQVQKLADLEAQVAKLKALKPVTPAGVGGGGTAVAGPDAATQHSLAAQAAELRAAKMEVIIKILITSQLIGSQVSKVPPLFGELREKGSLWVLASIRRGKSPWTVRAECSLPYS